jgi:E1A/CREB-binding protein
LLRSQNTGTSLLECFDAQAIDTHVQTTWELAQAAKVPAQMPINPGDECKVCGLTKLTFEPPCIYCTTCGQRIKRGQTYHCTPMEPGCEFRGFWCHGCLQEQKGDRVAWEGNQVGGCADCQLLLPHLVVRLVVGLVQRGCLSQKLATCL